MVIKASVLAKVLNKGSQLKNMANVKVKLRDASSIAKGLD